MLGHLGHDEEERMHSLDTLLFYFDTTQDNILNKMTSLACQILGMPTALVTLSGTHSLHIKAKHNFLLDELQKSDAIDQLTIQTNSLLVCQDLSQDARFSHNAYVCGEPHICFYAGMPLITKENYAIGTLSVIDYVPRLFSDLQKRDLHILASITMAIIEYRNAIDQIDAVMLLPNRQRLFEDINQLADIHQHYTLLLFDSIDLPYTYEMSRSLGMPTVESVLKDIAMFLRLSVSAQEKIYCIATGRFALLVKKERQSPIVNMVMTIADHIQQRYTSHIPLKPEMFIGYTAFQIPVDDPRRILREAMNALHDAQRKRIRIMKYHKTSKKSEERQQRAFTLLNDLSDTLHHNLPGLYLVYQPKLNLKTHRVIGAEALIRWRHTQFGEISPEQFIPLAEETTLMRPLTEWVIQQAAAQVKAWRQKGLCIAVSVNVTVSNFAEEDFIERLDRVLAVHELGIHDIEFECLETQKIVENSAALFTIKTLKERGFTISLDDFGTGYSNLNYLKNTPAHIIKLDKSLIKDMKSDQSSRTIVEHTITMLHKLDYLVLAEGVEDQETLAYLCQYGCDHGQGYYFSRPLIPGHFASWLKRRSPPDT